MNKTIANEPASIILGDIATDFWNKLPKPFYCLAPMADVTDAAFRRIIAKYSRHGEEGGGPDIFWTEFVSADGLAHEIAREKLLIDFKYTEEEHPIVAQIFGSRTENIKEAAKLISELGFDGIDINMGCPDKSIERQGAGASMIKTPEKVHEIISALREGASNLPISVKTRIGYNKIEIDKWIPVLLKENLSALTVHLRTRKEMSLVPAHWDLMKEIVALRDKISPETLIIGNGDVIDLDDAIKKVEETGCDGVMLGKAIFGNPWLFDKDKKEVTAPEKLRVLVEHTKLFEEILGGHKNFAIMKKHYKAYVNGFDGAKELRMKLMDAKNSLEIENLIEDFLR